MGGGGDKLPIDTPENIRESIVLWYNIEKQGATNDSMAKCPYLIDLSGNNHHARCYNFAWEQMSGVGGYKVPPMINKKGWYEYTTHYGNNGTYSYSGMTLHITKLDNFHDSGSYISYNPSFENNPLNASYDGEFITTHSMRLKVSGLSESGKKFQVGSVAYLQNAPITATSSGDQSLLIDENNVEYSAITQDGIYTIKENTYAAKSDLYNKINYPIFKIPNKNGEQLDVDITIEILPDYPGALVTDGVDDWVYVDKVPQFTNESGFTVVAKRDCLWNHEDLTYTALFTNKPIPTTEFYGTEFELVRRDTLDHSKPDPCSYSFGVLNHYPDFFPDKYGYMTSVYSNGMVLTKGDEELTDSSWALFTSGYNGIYGTQKYAFYSIALFNKDLEANEIDWIKGNLL